jgi:uncharacterized protein YraI
LRLPIDVVQALFVQVHRQAQQTDLDDRPAEPGASWPVIAEIPANADVRVLGCYSGWEGGWRQVTYEGQRGYVNSVLLQRQGAVYSQ